MTARSAKSVVSLRTWRLASGLVLVVYVTVHLSNHALGLISLDAQEAMRRVVSPIWRSVPGTVLLYSALIGHALLGLYALWRRETLRMPAWELWQLVLGLSVPLMLIPHVFGTRIAAEMLDFDSSYQHVVAALWSKTDSLIRQPLLVIIVWAHLVIGLHYWLRLRTGYRRWLPITYLIAVLIPLLALLGFREAGTELKRTGAIGGGEYSSSYGDYGAVADEYGYSSSGTASLERTAAFERRKDLALWVSGGLIVFVLVARVARRGLRTRRGTYRIRLASGRVVVAPLGQSLLEALRDARIPHASVCGGRARCTTCRVRIGSHDDALPMPNAAEANALRRIQADPATRLACQLRPTRDVQITPLVRADASPSDANVPGSEGRERALAVMFVDLRGSSRLAENRLPYDVVFILNRFFAETGDALRETGGLYSTFTGDGFMALYGTRGDLARGCRDAMRGAVAISRRLAAINSALASELRQPLRIGIGLHAGEAIFGAMGPPAHSIISAIGDTVNVAARLEAETKSHDCALVVSAACASASSIDFAQFPEHTVSVRGREQPVSYYAIADIEALAKLLAPAEQRGVVTTAYDQ